MLNNDYITKVSVSKVNRIYVKDDSVPRPKVKSLILFFLSLQLFFGIDYGFAGLFKVTTKNILRLYSTLLSTFMLIVILLPYSVLRLLLWYWLTAFQCLCFLIVLKTTKYSVFNFITDLQNLNCISALSESFGICVSLYSYSMFISKLSLILFRCFYGNTSNCHEYEPGIHELYATFSNALDFIPISPIIIYYFILCAVMKLKESFEKDMDVRKFLSLYRAIADCCDKIRPLYDNIIVIQLVLDVPKLLINIHNTLIYINKNAEWFSYASEWLYACHRLSQLLTPSIIAQITIAKMDFIKVKLHDVWMKETDNTRKSKIAEVIKYVKIRRLDHVIWGVVPTDLKLLVSVISVSISYLIIIVQLTHVYD